MNTQPRSVLKSTAPTRVSRNVMNPFGAKDLTALAASLSPVGPSAREALIARTSRGRARTSEGWQDDLRSVEGLTVALRRVRDRAETVSRARRPLLAGAHRDLREPLTAMLRLNNDWDVRWTDMVAVRMIEQQRQALEVMADLIDSFLTIAEPQIARQPALLTNLASRSAGGKLREASATPEPRAEEWSAEWSVISAVDRPEVPVAVGPASRLRCVLLVNEDPGVLGALRIYLLCAGYRVFAAANADEALDRAWMARMATSLIDIIIVNSDLTGDDDGLAVIDKTRLLLGYNVPAVLLTTQTSIEIGKAALATDVSLLRNPVNLDELNTLIGEVFNRPKRSHRADTHPKGPSSVAPLYVYEDPRMITTHPEVLTSGHFQGLILPAHPTSGTEDDDDDRNDEHAGENEAPVRAVDEGTETPEEFEVDDQDKLGHPGLAETV